MFVILKYFVITVISVPSILTKLSFVFIYEVRVQLNGNPETI